jgi:uroporphyrinogen III methyltransferase/synthase
MLWAKASRARDTLPTLLENSGITLQQLVVYENRDVSSLAAENIQQLREGRIHWITLTSPAAARRLAELLERAQLEPASITARIASISPLTSKAARNMNLPVHAEAQAPDWAQLLNSIAAAHAARHS